MFKPIQNDVGKGISIPLAASVTVTEGMGLVWASGYLTPVVATGEKADYVAKGAATTGAGEHTSIEVVPAAGSRIRFEATTFADTAATQRGVAYEFKTSLSVDNATAASANGFMVDEIIGAAADKTVRGFFL